MALLCVEDLRMIKKQQMRWNSTCPTQTTCSDCARQNIGGEPKTGNFELISARRLWLNGSLRTRARDLPAWLGPAPKRRSARCRRTHGQFVSQ
jgi:hypothetical protein